MGLVAVLMGICGPLLGTQVTFQVDLSHEPTISPNGIHILGPFNSYSPSATALTSTGPSRFAITLTFTAGATEIYKFVNGDDWNGTEGVYGECAFNTYRLLRIPVNDTVLPWVCFGFCDSACTPVSGIRLACVGNSITYGSFLADPPTECYPAKLQDTLGSSYLVGNFGAPGAAVIRSAGYPYFKTDPFRHLLTFQPDTVLLFLGINDSKSPIWGPYSWRFAADYDSMWLAIDTLPSDPYIWICLPTMPFSTAFGVDGFVVHDSIVPLIKAHARKHCLDQIDMHGFTSNFPLGFPDGLHPDAPTSKLMADEIYRVMHLPRPRIVLNGFQLSANEGFAWQWYRNGDTVATALGGRQRTLPGLQAGTYKVAVQVDSLLAHVLVSDSVVIFPAATESAMEVEVDIFPIPAAEQLFWRINGVPAMELEVRITDLQGKILEAERTTAHHGHIRLAGYPVGFYVFEVAGDQIATRRIFWKL